MKIDNNVILRVRDAAQVDAVRGALAEVCSLSLAEPGCERFEVHHSRTDRCTFLLIETWADRAALDAHRQAAAFLEVLVPRVLPLVEREPHDCERLPSRGDT